MDKISCQAQYYLAGRMGQYSNRELQEGVRIRVTLSLLLQYLNGVLKSIKFCDADTISRVPGGHFDTHYQVSRSRKSPPAHFRQLEGEPERHQESQSEWQSTGKL